MAPPTAQQLADDRRDLPLYDRLQLVQAAACGIARIYLRTNETYWRDRLAEYLAAEELLAEEISAHWAKRFARHQEGDRPQDCESEKEQ